MASLQLDVNHPAAPDSAVQDRQGCVGGAAEGSCGNDWAVQFEQFICIN